MDTLFVARSAFLSVALLSGVFLRIVGLLNHQDAKAVSLILAYVTLPSLALQSLLTYGFLGLEGLGIVLFPVGINVLLVSVYWIFFEQRKRADKYLLTGSVAGVAIGGVAYAFVEAFYGSVGLHFAILWDIGNAISVCVLSYLLLARGGVVQPERYVHADGGVYRGEWRSGKKQGLGVYTYPSGGRYEGRWANNLKEGLGVYYYPKGGWYEGEWKGGERAGLGLRVLSSGAVQAGLWQGLNKLESRDTSQCSFIAATTRDTAKSACRVPVGGGRVRDAVVELLKQPLLWATALAALSISLSYPIPLVVDFLTAHLATAHIPLTLVAFGVSLPSQLTARQLSEVAGWLKARWGVLLLTGAAAWLLSVRYTEILGVACICALGPLSEQVPYYTQLFHLNAALGTKIVSVSQIASLVALPTIVLALRGAEVSAKQLQQPLIQNLPALLAYALLVCAWLTTSWILEKLPPRSPKKRMKALESSSNAPSSELDQKDPWGQDVASTNLSSVALTDESEQQQEEIPIGIAWQEMRAKEAQRQERLTNSEEQAMQPEEMPDAADSHDLGPSGSGTEVICTDTGRPLEMGAFDSGEGHTVGEASEVDSWHDAGSVLATTDEEPSSSDSVINTTEAGTGAITGGSGLQTQDKVTDVDQAEGQSRRRRGRVKLKTQKDANTIFGDAEIESWDGGSEENVSFAAFGRNSIKKLEACHRRRRRVLPGLVPRRLLPSRGQCDFAQPRYKRVMQS